MHTFSRIPARGRAPTQSGRMPREHDARAFFPRAPTRRAIALERPTSLRGDKHLHNPPLLRFISNNARHPSKRPLSTMWCIAMALRTYVL